MELNQLYLYLFLVTGAIMLIVIALIPVIVKHQSKKSAIYNGYQPQLVYAVTGDYTRAQGSAETYTQPVQYTAPTRAQTTEIPVSTQPVRHTNAREYTVTGVKVMPSSPKPRYHVIRTKAS